MSIPRNTKKLRKAISPFYVAALVLWIICGSAYASFSESSASNLIGQECSNETSVMSVINSITQNPLSFLGFGQSASQQAAIVDGTSIELFASSQNHQAAQPESIALVALCLLIISLLARKTAQKSRV